jgi:hypothetical protein
MTLLGDVELVLAPQNQQAGPGGHVTITCDGPLAFDYEKGTATFERNVHVVDPNGELFSDTLVAYLDHRTHAIRYAEATGHVRIKQGQHSATSARAVYEPGMSKITLLGRPSLLIYPASKPESGVRGLGGMSPAPSRP